MYINYSNKIEIEIQLIETGCIVNFNNRKYAYSDISAMLVAFEKLMLDHFAKQPKTPKEDKD